MDRVPPDEGDWHVVKDSRGNDEIVTDEEREVTSEWYEEHYGEFSNLGRDPRYLPGWWVILAFPGALVVVVISALLGWLL